MKILIFYLSTENSHLPCRESLKNKLDQSLLNDIDLTVKDLTSFGLPEDKSFAEKMKSLAIQTMDAIFVIEKWQQEALTRIMDYSLWKKIHLIHFGNSGTRGEIDSNTHQLSEEENVNLVCSQMIDSIREAV